MAENNLSNQINELFDDITSDDETGTMSFENQNNEMFEMLGMSEDEIQKASEDLAKEDERFKEESPSDDSSSASTTDSQTASVEESGDVTSDNNSLTENTNSEITLDEESTEEDRLDDMLGDIFEDDISGTILDEDIDQTPENREDVEVSLNETPNPIEQMNSIIDQATQKSEETENNVEEASSMEGDLSVQSSDLEDHPDMDNEMFKEDPLQNETNPSYDAVMITDDDILNGIDFDEDLTKSDGLDGAIEDFVEESQLSPRELKKLKKQRAKEEKKAAKLAQKAEKLAAKQAAKEAKKAGQTTRSGEDIIKTVSDVAEKGLEEAAADSTEEIDLNSLFAEEAVSSDNDNMDSAKAAEAKAPFKERLAYALFGPDEDDEPTPEEIAEMERKKEEKEAKKIAKAEAKEAKAAEKAAKKNEAKEMAVVKKAAAKDKREKIRLEEEEEDAKEKKITRKSVITVVAILALLGAAVIFGTNQFNYSMVIKRAENYFEMQKYRKAYDQIVGVDVKNRDKEIKEKIYCVMYVQSQLDSYSNFCKLEMYDNALDSLAKGLKKYDAHIEEARKLGIEKDLDGLRNKIEEALNAQFGLTIDQVYQWMSLGQDEYTNQIKSYVASMTFTMDKLQYMDRHVAIRTNMVSYPARKRGLAI